jgi:hypothetical protein
MILRGSSGAFDRIGVGNIGFEDERRTARQFHICGRALKALPAAREKADASAVFCEFAGDRAT